MGVDAQMLVRTRQALIPADVRRLSVDLCEAFGHRSFWVWEDWENENGEHGRHALEIVREYSQDGDSIFPDAGETFIEVNIATRYYGDGYERGDISLIIAVASWLERRIADARIYYGGDSSGICAEPFDAAERERYWAHFCRVGHKPYTGGWGMFNAPGRVVRCGFCDVDMLATGGGQDRGFYVCVGCGKKVIQHHDGRAEIVPKGKDFFDMREPA